MLFASRMEPGRPGEKGLRQEGGSKGEKHGGMQGR